MRIGAHYGPAYRTIDHITGRTTFYGTEVSKAARIEPVTPPGAVFVTEPLRRDPRAGGARPLRLPLCRPHPARQEIWRLSDVPADAGLT